MATQEDFVLVRSGLLSRMRQHCQHCHDCNIPPEDLSDEQVFTLTNSLPYARKRKASQSGGSTQDVSMNISTLTPRSKTETTGSRQPLQSSGTRPPFLSGPESPQCRTAPSETSAQAKRCSESHKKRRVGKSRRDQALDRFIHNAPEGNRWRTRQLALGLNTVEKYEDVVQGLSRRAHIVSEGEKPAKLDGALIVVGKNLAHLTRSSLEKAGLQRSFAYFHVLILLSFCELLRRKGFSDQMIDELVQTSTKMGESHRKALLDTIPWIHQLIVELVRCGWTLQRATELFFISML